MGLPIPYFNFPNEPRSFGADQIDREKPVPDAGADNLHPIGQNEGALQAAGGAGSFGRALEKPLGDMRPALSAASAMTLGEPSRQVQYGESQSSDQGRPRVRYGYPTVTAIRKVGRSGSTDF
jgi:hypothetical protein